MNIMSFDGIIFTDSGGFQAFSLGFGMEHGVGKIVDNIFLENLKADSFEVMRGNCTFFYDYDRLISSFVWEKYKYL